MGNPTEGQQLGLGLVPRRELSSRERALIQNTFAMLERMGCKTLIVAPDGSTFGCLPEELQPRKKKRTMARMNAEGRRYGELRAYLEPYLGSSLPGQEVLIPFGKFAPESLRGSASSFCCNRFGNGSALTEVGKDGVYVLRALGSKEVENAGVIDGGGSGVSA